MGGSGNWASTMIVCDGIDQFVDQMMLYHKKRVSLLVRMIEES